MPNFIKYTGQIIKIDNLWVLIVPDRSPCISRWDIAISNERYKELIWVLDFEDTEFNGRYEADFFNLEETPFVNNRPVFIQEDKCIWHNGKCIKQPMIPQSGSRTIIDYEWPALRTVVAFLVRIFPETGI